VGAERRIAVDHVNVLTVGLGDDEAAVGPSRAGVSGAGATDYRGLIWRVVLWPMASSSQSPWTRVVSAGEMTRGSLGRTERMEVWVEETA
jgi:hypothetical protein